MPKVNIRPSNTKGKKSRFNSLIFFQVDICCNNGPFFLKPIDISISLFLVENRNMRRNLLTLKYESVIFGIAVFLFSCSAQKGLKKTAETYLINDPALQEAHTGISLYDPLKKAWLYNYQGNKYFIPASNTKIMSCYAGMKYLGKDLPGLEWVEVDTAILLYPTGDPTLLHPDYGQQPVRDFLRTNAKPMYMSAADWQTKALGYGWSWDDYSEYYMAERSAFPLYGNVVRWYQSASRKENPQHAADTLDVFISSEPEVSWPVTFAPPDPSGKFGVSRDRDENRLTITEGKEKSAQKEVPFVTHGLTTALSLLKDSIHKAIFPADASSAILKSVSPDRNIIYSQPADSMLKPMMHRSDNFFAEQTLLMAGRKLTGRFDEAAAISSLLQTDLKGLPQVPRWVDGSGLSRYNLFTPMDFVWVLNKMKDEFGMDRIKAIFPHPGAGTLKSYNTDGTDRIYAKTGTLTGIIALSGFVYTKKNHWLIFSILINNHRQQPSALRKKMEGFLQEIIEKY
jgi:D-alanyl-D-alanine carboxypeptidase/D-alanyl-D-alanine-endopeptidase (penicillin-binding protein 4)